MKNIEEQLNDLPKYKLGKKADLRLKYGFFVLGRKRAVEKSLRLIFSPQARLSLVSASLALMLLVSLPVYAYASDSVHDGHVLYPVKKSVENVELALKLSEKSRAKTYAKLAERRLDEAAYLAERSESDESLIKDIIKEAASNNQKSQAAFAGSREEEREELSGVIVEKKQKQQKILEKIASRIGINEDEATVDAVALAMEETKLPPGQTKKIFSFEARLPASIDRKPSTTPASKADEDEQSNLEGQEDKQGNKEHRAGNDAEELLRLSGERTKELEELKNEYEEEDVKNLIGRINRKLEQAGEKIEAGNMNGARGVLEATEALTNNAKHFLRPNKKNDKGKFKGIDAENSQQGESDTEKRLERENENSGNGAKKNKQNNGNGAKK